MKGVLAEAALVAISGTVLAFVANGLSPHGLKLTHDFFPSSTRHVPAPVGTAASSTSSTSPNPGTNAPSEQLAAQLQQEGLQLVVGPEAARLFHDPGYQSESIVFVDARDDEHYQAAHIPGAFQLDHYHAEKYFPTVLPACLKADRVLVYCTGGECEDSKFAAIILRDAGVPKEKISVYAGGITEWQSSDLPTESGERKSGSPGTAR